MQLTPAVVRYAEVGPVLEELREASLAEGIRVSWYSPSDAWKLALWGKNLTDERRVETGSFTSLGAYEFLTEPRTYGVEVSYYFD